MPNSGMPKSYLSSPFLICWLSLSCSVFIIRSIGITNKPSQIRVLCAIHETKRGRIETNKILGRDLLCQITGDFCGNITLSRISSWDGRSANQRTQGGLISNQTLITQNQMLGLKGGQPREVKKIHGNTENPGGDEKFGRNLNVNTFSNVELGKKHEKTKKMDFLLFFFHSSLVCAYVMG